MKKKNGDLSLGEFILFSILIALAIYTFGGPMLRLQIMINEESHTIEESFADTKTEIRGVCIP